MTEADKILREERIRAIVSWIAEGYFTKDIIKQCNSTFGIKKSSAYRYLDFARKEMRESRIKKIEDIIAFHHSARMLLYNNLENKKTPNGVFAAMDILKDLARLDQLYVDRTAHSFDNELQVSLTAEEIKKISKALDESH